MILRSAAVQAACAPHASSQCVTEEQDTNNKKTRFGDTAVNEDLAGRHSAMKRALHVSSGVERSGIAQKLSCGVRRCAPRWAGFRRSAKTTERE